MKFLFTSDVHGILPQYTKLVKVAAKEKCDIIIIGGDLVPKGRDSVARNPKGALEFFVGKVIPILAKAPCPVVMTCGNADYAACVPAIQTACKTTKNVTLYSSGSVIAFQDCLLFFFSYVPLSPHRLKDWELIDTDSGAHPDDAEPHGNMSDVKDLLQMRDVIVSVKEHGSVQSKLRENLESEQYAQVAASCASSIWIAHGPPSDCGLDICYGGGRHPHVGSQALRTAIERYQPTITLHGHVHETVSLSGKYHETFGSSHSYSSGNAPTPKQLFCLIGDTSAPHAVERRYIPLDQ